MSDHQDKTPFNKDDWYGKEFNEQDMNLLELFGNEIPDDTFKLHEGTACDDESMSRRYRELIEHDVKHRYSILDKIDVGGMKSIWRAEDIHTDRQIAMAVITDEKIASQEKCDAFIREARLTANLQHPNIVPVYDVSLDDNGAPFFTMKALKGETLERIIEKIVKGDEEYRRRFSRMNLFSIFQKVCDAIAYAHSKGVVHLDLKPSNIIVCEYGEVQVVDWGISQFIEDLADLLAPSWKDHEESPMISTHTICKVAEISGGDTGTSSSILAGSPGYMSPEQILGGVSVIDQRTDIYSLGAILHFILSGLRPVSGGTVKDVLDNTVYGKIRSIHNNEMPDQVSRVLEAITLKALDLDKADRYQSVGDMQQDLSNYIDGFATIAESANFLTHLQLLVKRHKFAALVVSFSIAVLTVIVAVSVNSINNQKKVADQQRIAAVDARQDAEANLKKVQEKSDYISSLTKQVAPLCHQAAYAFYLNNMFYSFSENINLALKFDSTLEYSWNYKIHQLVAQQRFNEALAVIKEHKQPYGLHWGAYAGLAPLAAKKKDGVMFQTYEDLKALMDIVSLFNRDYYIRYVFHEMNKQTFEPEAHFAVLKKLLYYFNPKMERLNFSYSKVAGGWDIDISNNPDLVYAYPLCGLEIVNLKADNTGIHTLDMITRWGIKEVSCVNSPIDTLVGREFLMSCEKLNISGTKFAETNYFYGFPGIKELHFRGLKNVQTPNIKLKHRATVYVDKEVITSIDSDVAKQNGFDFIFDSTK